ncbi:MAG TPA: GYD domain-containing protein [Chloroflexota bacterium]|nr:GYD domain-containing protein [Chloroflexota bacterium]
MPTYIILGNMTDQGAKNMKDLKQNVQQNRQSGERLGLTVKGWYLTQGQYDFVVVVEAPDDETMAAQVLTVAGRGNSRSETLRAFTLDEFDQIAQKIG